MHVIGTAGHVDHGKSTLVEALTGIDPDRLKEEKERAMTIDLGFAWMEAGEDQPEVGVIDVPGHRDFIENMLAGVGGIDLALLVIAADEGVMPQTLEHLAILNLLRVPGGIVALTKVDLVDDPDWLELVVLDVLDTLSGTVLADAPVVQVSPVTGQGMQELRRILLDKLRETAPRADIGQPRLPVDRIFSLTGFGTIVTGTLLDGRFRVGDPVIIRPGDRKARIRGLQTHRNKLEIARPGSRVAVNLAGIATDDLQRGDVVTVPGGVDETLLCDVLYHHLPEARMPLKHNMEVKVHVGSAEVVARTRVLGERQLMPGTQGWLQLALREPIAVKRGDHYILRRPSPAATIGGGQILDPHPGRRHRRFRTNVISRLETLAKGDPKELVLQTAASLEPVGKEHLIRQTGLAGESADAVCKQLLDQGLLLNINGHIYTSSGWQNLKQRLLATLRRFHDLAPLRLGVSPEELRSRLKCEPTVFSILVAELLSDRMISESRGLLRLTEHKISFSTSQQRSVDVLIDTLNRTGVNSASVKDVRSTIGPDVFSALIDLGLLVPVSEDVVYSSTVYESVVAQVRDYLQREGQLSVAELRDLLGTSRKYAIAILEHLDDIHVTERQGDYRRLVS